MLIGIATWTNPQSVNLKINPFVKFFNHLTISFLKLEMVRQQIAPPSLPSPGYSHRN